MNLQRAQMMLLDLLDFYGLTSWSMKFDRSVSRLGLCSYKNKTISLGTHATQVNSEEQVLNTCLHEIAHALIGPGYGHGAVWQWKASEIGCDGERLSKIAADAPAKYSVKCLICNHNWKLYRLSNRYKNKLQFMCHKGCGKEKSFGKLVLEIALDK